MHGRLDTAFISMRIFDRCLTHFALRPFLLPYFHNLTFCISSGALPASELSVLLPLFAQRRTYCAGENERRFRIARAVSHHCRLRRTSGLAPCDGRHFATTLLPRTHAHLAVIRILLEFRALCWRAHMRTLT